MSALARYTDREINVVGSAAYGLGLLLGALPLESFVVAFGKAVFCGVFLFAFLELLDRFARRGTYAKPRSPFSVCHDTRCSLPLIHSGECKPW